MSDRDDEPLGRLYSDVARLFWRRLEAAFSRAGHDITSAEVRVAMAVVEEPGLRQRQLAERLHIEPMTLTAHLDRLVAKGLVERRADPLDRRAKQVHPTPAAAPMLETLRAASAEVRVAQVGDLDADEVAVLRRLLQRVRTGLVRPVAEVAQ